MWLTALPLRFYRTRSQNFEARSVEQKSKSLHLGSKSMLCRVINQLQTTGVQGVVQLTTDSGDTLVLNVSQEVVHKLQSGESKEIEFYVK
jgi:hypothetical protein